MTKPNRIVLVFNGQRIFDVTGVSIEVVEQDDGMTLKVLAVDLPTDEKLRSTARHMTRLGQSLKLDLAQYLPPECARTIHLAPGTPTEYGVWCDRCQLPSVVRVPVNGMTGEGVTPIGEALYCVDHHTDDDKEGEAS